MTQAIIELLAVNLALILAVMAILWAVSLAIGDVSFVDSAWGLGFVVMAWSSAWQIGSADRTDLLILAMTTFWGLRLGIYLFWRWRKSGADPRYERILSRSRIDRRLFSLIYVFMLQGVLLWFISAPAQIGQLGNPADGRDWIIWTGVVLWLVGMIFETVGDAQLTQFKSDPANQGKVLDTGLWRYTRHPNYFGDACVWWGIYLVAASTSPGALTVLSPVLMTFLLLKWSGVPLLEKQMQTTRPGYAAYASRTSPFIPMPPKSRAEDRQNG